MKFLNTVLGGVIILIISSFWLQAYVNMITLKDNYQKFFLSYRIGSACLDLVVVGLCFIIITRVKLNGVGDFFVKMIMVLFCFNLYENLLGLSTKGIFSVFLPIVLSIIFILGYIKNHGK